MNDWDIKQLRDSMKEQKRLGLVQFSTTYLNIEKLISTVETQQNVIEAYKKHVMELSLRLGEALEEENK